jgi:hypothetical protein
MGKRIIVFIMMSLIVLLPVMVYAESSRDDSDVVIDEAVLEAKDPILATVIAVGPGFLVHGWGNYYSSNYKTGLSLTGLELLSIGAMVFGAVENTQPDMMKIYGSGVQRGGAVTFGFGFCLFIGTWIADIFLAGNAADQYNLEHNLEFKNQEETLLNGNIDNRFAAIYHIRF